jgi:hypothetical protein
MAWPFHFMNGPEKRRVSKIILTIVLLLYKFTMRFLRINPRPLPIFTYCRNAVAKRLILYITTHFYFLLKAID